ncbi:MAG: FlgD immunoglobulin-like domain containing protein [Candidatus Cryosericum sp.]
MLTLIVLLGLGGGVIAKSSPSETQRSEQGGPALVRPPLGLASERMDRALGDSAPAYPFAVPERVLPGDVYWSKDFGRRGIYGTVFTACEHNGDLYVGGSFSYAGSTRCNNVARWDGLSWQALGTGVWLDGGGTKVLKLLEYDGDVIASGLFDYAGGVPLPGLMVAGWNGSSWYAVSGDSLQDLVEDISVHADTLWASGGFYSSTTSTHRGSAVWTGQAWVARGTQTALGTFGVQQDTLYATSGRYLYGWVDGDWRLVPQKVGCPNPVALGDYIRRIASDGTRLAVGGAFECAIVPPVGHYAHNVAMWTGAAWDTLGNGLFDADYDYYEEAPEVWAVSFFGGSLFAGGDFLSSENHPYGMKHIGRWDGSAWNPLGSGCSENVYTLLPYNGELVAGGWMGYAGGQDVWGIASWDGTDWSGFGPLGNGVTNPVYALTVWNDRLIAAGQFDRAGPVQAHGIAAFDGTAWQPLGSGLDGFPPYLGELGLGAYDGSLIVAGDIVGAGGVASPHVARWDGSQWWPMGAGLPEAERAICEFEGQLYVGKYRWTGGAWEQWLPADGDVRCLAEWEGSLVACGGFTNVDGIPMSKIVRWDGQSFYDVGGGLPTLGLGPETMVVHAGELVVGGAFSVDGSYSIARWNGSAWLGFATGLNLAVTALVSNGDYLFAGGLFDATFKHVAYWDGTSWRRMGNGCTGASYYRTEAKALALYHGSLYVGGDFTIAGDAPSEFIAKWRDPAVPVYLRRFSAERSGATAVVRCELGESLTGERLEVWREEPGRDRSRVGELSDPGSTSLLFTDQAPPPGEADYWLRGVTASEDGPWYGPAHLAAVQLPERLALTSVAPNPFNPRTTIRYSLPQPSHVTLGLYDQRGRLVRSLADSSLPAGEHEVEWDGRDAQGALAASGTYIVRLVTEQGVRASKITLAK